MGPPHQGDTPLATALEATRSFLINFNDSERPNVVILITDGDLTCQGVKPITEAMNTYQAGVPALVVNFDRAVTNPDTLRQMAIDGGTSDYLQAYSG